MIIKKTNIANGLILLVVALIIYFFAGFLGNKFIHTGDCSKYVFSVNNILHEEENVCDKIFLLTNTELKKSPDLNPFVNEQINAMLNNGISVFVYRNDSLLYWTDNRVPVPNVWNDSIFPDGLLNLKNGYYECRTSNNGIFKSVALILIKQNFRYQNDYLSNNFNPRFCLNDETTLNTSPGGLCEVFSKEYKYLFSLSMPELTPLSLQKYMLLFIMYLASFILLSLSFYKLLHLIRQLQKSNCLLLLSFALSVVAIRFIMIVYGLPAVLTDTPLFGPQLYASSYILPSLGDLFFNVTTVTIIIIIFYRKFKFRTHGKRMDVLTAFLWLLVFLFLLRLGFYVLESLVLNSNIPLNLNDLFSFNLFSPLLYLIILSVIISLILAGFKIGELNCILIKDYKICLIIWLASVLSFALINKLSGISLSFGISLVMALISLVFILSYRISRGKLLITRILLGTAFLSASATFVLHQNIEYKEKEKRKLIAMKLVKDKDPIAEYLFNEITAKIHADVLIEEFVDKYPLQENMLRDYISQKYFCNYWDKYNIQFTLCSKSDKLTIQPNSVNVNCNAFFNNIINSTGSPTLSPNLFFVSYGTGDKGYLGVVPLRKTNLDSIKNDTVNLYVEFIPKFVLKGLGLPELLIDRKADINKDIVNYSYARYKTRILDENYGKFIYPVQSASLAKDYVDYIFFNYLGYNHLILKADNNREIVISKKNEGVFDILAPFSYLFVFISIIGLPGIWFIDPSRRRNSFMPSFQGRLQITMVLIIILSFCVIGISAVLYIKRLNDNKNNDALSEKAHSVLIELQHKLSDRESLTPEMSEELTFLLRKFHNVFFTDINLFDINGELLATTRPELYEEGIISTRMDAKAYNVMKSGEQSRFVNSEAVGEMEYLSAYIPFRNNNNKIAAYLNLPYFARQSVLEREIATFITAFINIFIFLTGLAVVLALIVAKYVTRPLQLIRNKISSLKLGHKNEKIEWGRDDEIGSLITEYNRLTDELEQSAALLAQSERESAWREMARQVAHEIKNPLTPMKLSVQYLQKAWKENAPDIDKRLDKFTHTIIEQIDTLSEIATEFSDFAQMPATKPEKIEINQIIINALELYNGIDNIEFVFSESDNERYYVKADKKQLLRVFNNLISNSVQAIDNNEYGRIEISLFNDGKFIIIYVNDNGKGIPEEQRDRIFTPNFSTKSGGMGLGLAIVKSILENSGGEISFEHAKGQGTTFIVKLPVFVIS